MHGNLIKELDTNLTTGLTTDQASQRREQSGSFNVVTAPVDCPAWMCIILPCIKHIPSMKAYKALVPDDAEVLRNGKWIRYDAASLVKGDVIRVEEGDVVPADCVLLPPEEGDNDEMLVDLRPVTGEDRLKSISSEQRKTSLQKLYWGGKVVQGGSMAVITNIGPNTLVAKLILEKRFPPKEPILEAAGDDGIAMGEIA